MAKIGLFCSKQAGWPAWFLQFACNWPMVKSGRCQADAEGEAWHRLLSRKEHARH